LSRHSPTAMADVKSPLFPSDPCPPTTDNRQPTTLLHPLPLLTDHSTSSYGQILRSSSIIGGVIHTCTFDRVT
jgi:hypothetical protein